MNEQSDCAIQTMDLVKRYGGRTCVDGLNLSIRSGELFALLGPNGAGKTTTIKMLCCLVPPSGGTAMVMGHDIREDPRSVKRIINVSPQETAIAGHLNMRENLMLSGGVYGLGRKEASVRADGLIGLLSLGEQPKLQARRLSGGMQRRLSIAMALMSRPKVLFLDEPTLGLDPKARKTMWKHIEGLKGKTTILLTTHYLEEADALADRVAIMDKGLIVASGTPAELKRTLGGSNAMIVSSRGISENVLAALKAKYENVRTVDAGIEISGENADFDGISAFFKSRGIGVDGISRKESSLDDVFLSLTEKELQK